MRTLISVVLLVLLASAAAGQDPDDGPPHLDSALLDALALRGIGPAFMSGRIGDLVVDPTDHSVRYVAAASGGVWKTSNAGTTWEPIFDDEGSYSIGALALDPNDPLVLWVGTGENNSQRSVGYGDGLYKSVDGGTSFTKVGLDRSEHIGMIRIDPRDSDVVYVAAQGPLWAPGGDRGLYKTTDAGATWTRILDIDEHTGVSEVHFDPRDPDVLYAVAYQRRRHVWTLINGGPSAGLYKSTDAGATWREINEGLPDVDLGRIGLAVSPIRPNVVYAVVEAAGDDGGFFRSTTGGERWTKVGDYVSQSPQYYQEIFADPHRFDRIYAMDTFLMVSEDGGATFTRLSPGVEGATWNEADKHVDNHALWIDPDDPDHLIIGTDGGVYETWDRGQTHDFVENLPLTQFYKIAVDRARPFYNVYGGTQDNATQGGPSRTLTTHGITNRDWFVTVFGDGFDPAVDPENPDIVYSQWQYGGLVRYDKRLGHTVDIKPREAPGGPALRWNWDSALLLSPHDNERLYYGAQILFRSDDRGHSWRAVSPDLTRNMDRNMLEVMGRIWSVDAVAKNTSTSFYGTIVALAESPLVEDLLYAGTDDGLVQVTEDGGANWREIDRLPGVPEMTYVNDIEASRHDPNTVFVALNNHKMGDFTPYLVKSTDRGRTWTSIAGDLPERGSVYSVVQDPVDPDLLFVGTEFGLYTTLDGGARWIELDAGLPTIAVRDLEIQPEWNDLVVGTFGRGIYVLDDYTPLRTLDAELLAEEAHLFPVREVPYYVETTTLAPGPRGFMGTTFFRAPNPPYGAVFTYYLRDALETRAEIRRGREGDLSELGEDTPYPSWDELKAEDREEEPAILLTVRDDAGAVVRRVEGETDAGLHRVAWDLRYPSYGPLSLSGDGMGPLAAPGRYTAELAKRVDGVTTALAGPVTFEVVPVLEPTLPVDLEAATAFQRETADLQRAVQGASAAASEAAEELDYIKAAIERTPTLDPALYEEARALELRLTDLREHLSGDPTRTRRSEPAPPGLLSRVSQIISGHWEATTGPTQTHRDLYRIAREEYEAVEADLRRLLEEDLPAFEARLEEAGAPWTPGRPIPRLE